MIRFAPATLSIFVGAVLFLASCDSNPSSSGFIVHAGSGMPLGEPIVVDVSPGIAPNRVFSNGVWYHEAEFVAHGLIGRYDDFMVAYTTPSTSDELVEVQDGEGDWKGITEPFGRYGGGDAITGHYALLSTRGLTTDDYVDNGFVRVRSDWAEIDSLFGVRLASDYRQMPVLVPSPDRPDVVIPSYRGLTWSGTELLLTSGYNDNRAIYGIDTTGTRLTSRDLPEIYASRGWAGVAFDGRRFWLYNRLTRRIYPTGNLSTIDDGFSAPIGSRSALEYGNGSLWMATSDAILRIDPEASLSAGSAVVVDTLEMEASAGEDIEGLAFVGTSLLAVLHYYGPARVIRLSLDGTRTGSWELPVLYAGPVAWDGEALWVFHHGVSGLRWGRFRYTSGPLLSRFRVPG